MVRNNDNVTVIDDLKNNSNTNNNVIDRYARARHVENIADRIIEKIGNEQYRGFYCKVAWKLSEARIWTNLETAIKANPAAPGRLFTYLCKRDGV